MRRRLTLAFVALAVALLLLAGVVRFFALRDLVREQEAGHLRQEAALVAALVQERQDAGEQVDAAALGRLVGPETRLEYAPVTGGPVVVRGADYDGADDAAKDLSAMVSLDDGATVAVSESEGVVTDIVGRDVGSLVALFLLIAAGAGTVGFFVARALSLPFQRLAGAAEALGRGRFDLDLPRTSIPEAAAIGAALRTSALQLEDRLHRERDFAQHASHVLRTPLTGLRLELEDLTLRDDVPEDAKSAAARCLTSVDEVSAVAGELVELSRAGTLVEGAQLPLVDLATQLAQRWADRLGVRDRALSAAAEGDLDLTYTPGPVEHVLDLLLADVVRRGSGAVRLVFHGEDDGHLRVDVGAAGSVDGDVPGHDHHDDAIDRIGQARTVVESLGGNLRGDHPADGLVLLLPRR